MPGNRRTIRLRQYPYWRAGAYYMTICTENHLYHFGAVHNGNVVLNSVGEYASAVWRAIETRFPFIVLDEYVFMPNHMHGIMWIVLDRDGVAIQDLRGERFHEAMAEACRNLREGTGDRAAGCTLIRDFGMPLLSAERGAKLPGSIAAESIPAIIGSFKSIVSRWAGVTNPEFNWQARYYDKVIRSLLDLHWIREYIRNNPRQWTIDRGQDRSWYP